MIHATVKIGKNTKIGKNVSIGAYCDIGTDVILADNVTIEPHVTVRSQSMIGENCHLYPFVSIGNGLAPITIEAHCHIREFTHIATEAEGQKPVHIHDHCYIMAYVDIKENVIIEKNTTLTNHVVLHSGVLCQERVIIGAKASISQDCTIGTGSMIGGVSKVMHDIPPFCLVEGSPTAKIRGLNLVGMRRTFQKRESINHVKKYFLDLKKNSFDPAYAKTLLPMTDDPYAKYFINFVIEHIIEQ